MTLSFSRHSYIEFVFDQEVDTWLRRHRRAFEWFDGVVRRVVLDNLKAAIIQARSTIKRSRPSATRLTMKAIRRPLKNPSV